MAQSTSVSVSGRGTSTSAVTCSSQAMELALANQVSQRLAGRAPRKQACERPRISLGQRRIVVRQQPGARASEQVREQELGIEPLDANCPGVGQGLPDVRHLSRVQCHRRFQAPPAARPRAQPARR